MKENKISKIEESKNTKRNNLMDAGFTLFTEKGFNETSIQDIVNKAKVAKGTFYLYFKDKYELHNSLIANKSKALFDASLKALNNSNIKEFDKQIIFIIDYVINQLVKKPILIKLFAKNLSLGIYSKNISKLIDSNYVGVKEQFLNGVKENNIKLKKPEVTLFMIIELVGSTCFSSILKNEPLPIEQYKPYLYKTISNMILNEK